MYVKLSTTFCGQACSDRGVLPGQLWICVDRKFVPELLPETPLFI